MKRTFSTLLLVVALLIIASVPAGANGSGVDDLRGQWVFAWTLQDGTKQPPLTLYINDIGPGIKPLPRHWLFALPGERRAAPLSLSALYHPTENT